MGLNLLRRTRRRLPMRARRRLSAPGGLNVICAADFMADTLYGGRWFRTLNVIDEGNRQALGIEMHGKPAALRVDNGAEFTAHAFTEWCEEQKIELFYIEPGKPDQNAFVERFNRTYREECLTRTCSTLSSRYAKSLNCGSRNITRSGHTTALAVCRP